MQHFKQLHFTTMELLLQAACNEIFEEGKQSAEARAEALTDHTAQDEEDVVMPMRYKEHEDAAGEAGQIGNALEVGVYAQEADV